MDSPEQVLSKEQEFFRRAKDYQEPFVPYEHGGVAICCQFCIGRSFRRSRLRMADVRYLFQMRYPVRCLRCSQRQRVSFTVAGIAIPSHVRTPRNRKRVSQG